MAFVVMNFFGLWGKQLMDVQLLLPGILLAVEVDRGEHELLVFVLLELLLFIYKLGIWEYQARYTYHKARHYEVLVRLLERRFILLALI